MPTADNKEKTMQDVFTDNGDTAGEEDERLLDQPAARSIGRGIGWIHEAFLLFREYWAAWMLIALVLFVAEEICKGIMTYSGMIGAAVYGMFVLFKAGGIMSAASFQEYEETPPRIGHLFAIFDSKIFEFVLLFVLMFLSAVAWALLLYGAANALGWLGNTEGIATLPVSLVLLLVFWYLSWQLLLGFAPVLVFLQSETPFAAILLSAKAAVKNILPLALCGVCFAFFYIVILTLPGLREGVASYVLSALLLALNILGYLTVYAAYRDIWFEPAERDPVTVGYR
ncbi:hypothetical protein HMPREF9120_02686 [Neisseria sp. oral taxon 020 str. F0370]|nr:hypothetical protein CGZ77_00325 [Neisseria sp. KEM232]EKY03483.1 hypothetical protein HMPREF9120_02686 [Neisseria sp. oral taxon 020 str. F0370]